MNPNRSIVNLNKQTRIILGIIISMIVIILSIIISLLVEKNEPRLILANIIGFGSGSFIGWWFVSGIVMKLKLIEIADKDTQMKPRFLHIPVMFSLLGLILLVIGVAENELTGVLMGAFQFLAFMSPLLEKKHYIVMVFHRLSVIGICILYYVFFPSVWGTILLLIGILSLVDTISIIIRKKPLILYLAKDTSTN